MAPGYVLQMWIFIFITKQVTAVEWGSSSRWRCEENNFRFLLSVVGSNGDRYCIGRIVKRNNTWVGSVLEGTEVIMYVDDLNRTKVGNSFELLRYHPSAENLQFVWHRLTTPLSNDIINARADIGSARYIASYRSEGRVYIGYLDRRRTCMSTFNDRLRTSMKFCGREIYVLGQVSKRTTQSENCINGWGLDYVGNISTTKSGLTCQSWTVQRPSFHRMNVIGVFPDPSINVAGNFCRNPDGYVSPWCYTTQPEIQRWESCDIPQCAGGETGVTNNNDGDAPSNNNGDVPRNNGGVPSNKNGDVPSNNGGVPSNNGGVPGNNNGDVTNIGNGDLTNNNNADTNSFGRGNNGFIEGSTSLSPLPTHVADIPGTTEQILSFSGLEVWLPILLALLLLLLFSILAVYCKHHHRHRSYHAAANKKARDIQQGLAISQVGRNLSGSQTATKNDRAGSPAVPFQSYPAVLPPPGQREIQLPTKRTKRSLRSCIERMPVVPLDIKEDFTYEEIATPRTAKRNREKDQKQTQANKDKPIAEAAQAPTPPMRSHPKLAKRNTYTYDDDDSDYVPPTPSVRESVTESISPHLDLSGHLELEFGAIPYPEITHTAGGTNTTDNYKSMTRASTAETSTDSGTTCAKDSEDSEPRYVIDE